MPGFTSYQYVVTELTAVPVLNGPVVSGYKELFIQWKEIIFTMNKFNLSTSMN
jgi:hypothetical protein